MPFSLRKPVFFLALLLACGCNKSDKGAISSTIPHLKLKTLSGETFSIGEDDKSVRLVVFWATWCRPCVLEIPSLIKLQEKYRDRKFQVISINMDENPDDPKGEKIVAFLENFGINYPVLICTDAASRTFGGIEALPTSFLIGRDGKIKQKMMGLYAEEELEHIILEVLNAS